MFFIGIFGIEGKEKELKTFAQAVCPLCGRFTQAVLRLHYTCFHIFFIPTFRWNKHYYVKLRCCGAVYEADAAYADELKTASDIDFSRLILVSSGFGRFSDFETRDTACTNCGRSYDASFAYCPHCGARHP
jgi:RNA polymerase subunit RPABC4/transcription elongation factor Spt4